LQGIDYEIEAVSQFRFRCLGRHRRFSHLL